MVDENTWATLSQGGLACQSNILCSFAAKIKSRSSTIFENEMGAHLGMRATRPRFICVHCASSVAKLYSCPSPCKEWLLPDLTPGWRFFCLLSLHLIEPPIDALMGHQLSMGAGLGNMSIL